MPELPDVEATRRYLLKSGLVGRSVQNVELFWSRAVRTPGIEDFVLTLCGQRIEDVGRRAKFLLFPLDQGWTLCNAPADDRLPAGGALRLTQTDHDP